jgi:Arc/MetJ family transcription regulator
VYGVGMARTNIDLDDDLVQEVMRRYHLPTKREAVHFALKRLAGDTMTLEEALAMRGTGWEGDLDAIRGDRPQDAWL